MNLTWYFCGAGLWKSVETTVFENFSAGVEKRGDTIDTKSATVYDGETDADVAVCWGIGPKTRRVLDAYRAEGKHVIILDKGMIRPRNRSKWRRVYIDEGTPLAYMNRIPNRPIERWKARKVPIGRRGTPGENAPVLVTLNSQKHHDFWFPGEDAHEYAEWLVGEIRKRTDRPIIYRPKYKGYPSRPIEGTTLSEPPEMLEEVLKGEIHCLVTHTSACGVLAALKGIPVIALGPSAMHQVAAKSLDKITDISPPGIKKVQMWARQLAWCEWTLDEMQKGSAWRFIRDELKALGG